MRFSSLVLFSALSASVGEAAVSSKTIADLAPASRRHRRLSDAAAPTIESSGNVVFLEDCSPDAPVTFPLSMGEGKGMIGLMDNTAASISLDSSNAVDLEVDTPQADVFSPMYVYT